MTKLAVGQRWTFKGETQGADSTVLIGRIDERPGQPSIIHLTVENLASLVSEQPIEIGHMPFSEDAVAASVVDLVDEGVAVHPGLDDGIAEWLSAAGGVFEISIIEAVEAMQQTSSQVPPPDDFDEIVIEMREKRTQPTIDVVYRKLFSLPRWFFIADPYDGQSPVQWIYDEGPTEAPAILAFTSHERAVEAATALNIYAEGESVGIMQPSVEDAVEWISSPGFVNEWLSFNETRVSFPLFSNEAKPRFEYAAGQGQ